MELTGQHDHQFRIILRQNRVNPMDFSIILVFVDDDGGEYRLVRVNGRHPSPHTNRLEKRLGSSNATFGPCFHVHRATQRYQDVGLPIDGYAEPCTEYGDFGSALNYFRREANCVVPEGGQLRMFEEGWS